MVNITLTSPGAVVRKSVKALGKLAPKNSKISFSACKCISYNMAKWPIYHIEDKDSGFRAFVPSFYLGKLDDDLN